MTSAPFDIFTSPSQSSRGVTYDLLDSEVFRITNYDQAPAFSSFLPGLGGACGIPLWCMYVNRGQSVVSYGVGGKNSAIAEFLSATWAYQLVGTQGFRTFCKIDQEFYEPFRDDCTAQNHNCDRTMYIEASRIRIVEQNHTLGMSFQVEYFSPVDQPLGSLVRRVRVSNLSDRPRTLELLDGLPLIVPAGCTDANLKTMRRMAEAYAYAELIDDSVPRFAAKVLQHDEEDVTSIKVGNFYAAWEVQDGALEAIRPVIDPHIVFGPDGNLSTPRRFIVESEIDYESQIWENRLPCSLVPFRKTLAPEQSIELVACSGSSTSDDAVLRMINGITSSDDVDRLRRQAQKCARELITPAFTASSQPVVDSYARFTYLDNVLRGGTPLLLPSKNGPTLLHLYSRRHGDLERDYNDFELPAIPLSSGAGNYRDICQNRRSDVYFCKNLRDEEIRMFASLLRADGYNPVNIHGYRWRALPGTDVDDLCTGIAEETRKELHRLIQEPFQPGQLLEWLSHGEQLGDDAMDWMHRVLERCERVLVAEGHEGGYWTDHWTYITDLLTAYADVYPDQLDNMLTETADVEWFDDGAYVLPRSEKYVSKAGQIKQLGAVVEAAVSPIKLPAVTLFGKLCTVLTVKAMSFDYAGRGIEMEAGRPGWNDALNGLPALCGSSTCETSEIARLTKWLLEHLDRIPDTVLPVQVAEFLEAALKDLKSPTYSWDRSATIREAFRKSLYEGITPQTRLVEGEVLEAILKAVEARADRGVTRSMDEQTSLIHTYFRNDVAIKFDDVTRGRCDAERRAHDVRDFKQAPLPLFLEGQVHRLRLLRNTDEARQVYESVRTSGLFDEKLRMYKANECLDSWSEDIGRVRSFTRGWFENESIWLHMSYKYLLEILRSGLHDEFFKDAESMLVPFMNPAVYGRSILENSSFLASSANPDPNAHGRGFVARLSGATAEFLSMWLLLTMGREPFFVRENNLHFRLRPILPASWFSVESKSIIWNNTEVILPENTFACALLGEILLVYRNEARRATYGPEMAKPVRYLLDGNQSIESDVVGPDYALAIRERRIKRIDVFLA